MENETQEQIPEAELIQQLLDQWTKASEGYVQVEGLRYYIKSAQSDTERYHILSTRYGELLINQIDEDAKYQQRVTFGEERTLPLIAALLQQRLSYIKEEAKALTYQQSLDETLGDLDDHPF